MKRLFILLSVAIALIASVSSCLDPIEESYYYQWGLISGTQEIYSTPTDNNLLYLETKTKIIDFDNANHGTGSFANDDEAIKSIDFARRSEEFDKLYEEFVEREATFDNNEHYFQFTNVFALLKSINGKYAIVLLGNEHQFTKEPDADLRVSYETKTDLPILEELQTKESATIELTVPLEECSLIFDEITNIIQTKDKTVRIYNESTRSLMAFNDLNPIASIKNISVENKNLTLEFTATKEHASQITMAGDWYALVPITLNPSSNCYLVNVKVPLTIK